MRTLRRIFIDVSVFLAVIITIIYLYNTYAEKFADYFYGEEYQTVFINDMAIAVTIADDAAKRRQGLSGVESLREREGKLFIFEEEGDYGIWMKDMKIPIDVFWIDNSQNIVHVEENLLPGSYPTVYHSPVPARFVLETNAFFSDTFRVKIGDRVGIPVTDLPVDLR